MDNTEDVQVTGAAIILPPVFRKRDRRDRNIPNPIVAIPLSTVPSNTSNPQSEPSPHMAQQSYGNAQQPVPPLPSAATVGVIHQTAAPADYLQFALGAAIVPPSLAASPTPKQMPQQSNSSTPNTQSQFDSLDDNTRIQLYDWFLRSGPMAQSLRNAKNW